MASFRVVLVVHGRPVTFLADADSVEQVRPDLEAAWSDGSSKVYRSPDGERVEVVWRNLAVLDITSITEVQ